MLPNLIRLLEHIFIQLRTKVLVDFVVGSGFVVFNNNSLFSFLQDLIELIFNVFCIHLEPMTTDIVYLVHHRYLRSPFFALRLRAAYLLRLIFMLANHADPLFILPIIFNGSTKESVEQS